MTLIQIAPDNDQLLHRLKGRLASVQARLIDATAVQPTSPGYLYAAGQLIELRSEQQFLVDLIEQIEEVSE